MARSHGLRDHDLAPKARPHTNWVDVGTTKGRGKLEKHHRNILPLKSILIYPLQKNFRAILAG